MNILILGGGGFIGGHLARKFKDEGHWVRIVDLKYNEYFDKNTISDQYIIGDLRDPHVVSVAMFGPNQTTSTEGSFHEVYQLAADMGGAGYIFTGDHDTDILHNSALINLNVCHEAIKKGVRKLFYSSSACIYPEYNQLDPDNPNCEESSAYPAAPDSEYGWEKIFSERLYKSAARNYGLNVRIARFHNIFGPQGTWKGGKEKAPAAICRKVAEAPDGGSIDIWGDGNQTRSFLYISECVEAIRRLMKSECSKIVNIGSEEMISINDLAKMIIGISGKNLTINNIEGPTGVRGRNSDNRLYKQEIGWVVNKPLADGIKELYRWISLQLL